MADTIVSHVLESTDNVHTVVISNLSDGTGAAYLAVDKSAMTIKGTNPAVAVGHMAIEKVQWNNTGFTSILLSWDHDTDDTALYLGAGQGELDFSSFGGLHDPQSAGGTGDLLVTPAGATAGDVYTIILQLRFYP